MGWLGNIFIIIGLWLAGDKNKSAFIFSIIGESVWVVYSLLNKMYDLAFVCAVFAIVAVRNWYKWNKESKS
jgi:hypothetical protein